MVLTDSLIGYRRFDLFDTNSGDPIAKDLGHEDWAPILFADMIDDGRTLITAGCDGSIALWDTATGKPDRVYAGLPDDAIRVTISGDGSQLLARSADGSTTHWDVETGSMLYRCYLLGNGTRWLTLLPDGRYFGNAQCIRYRKPGTIELIR